MTVQEYQDLTGVTISTSRESVVYAQITRTQSILETLLGFTLDPELVDENEYTEIGKSNVDCPCALANCGGVEVGTLAPADDVEFAYRLYTYHARDRYLAIDPATAVHAIKLVKDGVTFRTLDPDEYRLDFKRGIVRFIEQCNLWCACRFECTCVQLAVDADWVWPDAIPVDLQMVWADMVTYYADNKHDIKRETLGPHTYERFDREKPEDMSVNMQIIKRYAGPNGTATRMPL